MSWVAVGVGVAGVAAGAMSADAAKDAASSQAGAAENAAQASMLQFNKINSQQAPYRQSGYGALTDLNKYMGIRTSAPPQTEQYFDNDVYVGLNPDVAGSGMTGWEHYTKYGANEGRAFVGNDMYRRQLEESQYGANTPGFGQFTHQFDANDLNANLAPNYAFMLDQGQRSTNNFNNSTAGLLSGNALQGLNTFTQNYAKNAYQDAFNNYTTNQNNIYSRLSNLAGLGQTSLQQSGAAGTAAVESANNYRTSAAAANAAGRVGAANAYAGTLNTLGGLVAYYGMQ